MRTPKEFTQNLKDNIITEEMLDAALWSVNKRAKNWRDKKRSYKHGFDYYNNYDKAENEEKKMYKKKETLLSVLNPVCIHKEFIGYDRIRVYDYQKNYDKIFVEKAYEGLIVWQNSYVDRDKSHGGWDYDFFDCNRVYFFDYENCSSPQFHYYLYYACGSHTFHTPISESDVSKYPGLEVVTIGRIETMGHEIDDLFSVQFVDKVISLIESGEYTYQDQGIHGRVDCEEYDFQINLNKLRECRADDVVYDNWEYIAGLIKKYLEKHSHEYITNEISEVEITETEKLEIEEQCRIHISSALPGRKRLHGLTREQADVKKEEEVDKLKYYRHKIDKKETIPFSFFEDSMQSFAGTSGVTIEKLCDLLVSLYGYAFSKNVKNEKQRLYNDYIRTNIEEWIRDEYIKKWKKANSHTEEL